MLMPLAVTNGVVFPATSLQEPTADRPITSTVRTMSGEHVPMPDPPGPSVPENETVTSVLFQPFAFAGGLAVATAAGSVVSRWMTTLRCAVPPLLVAVQ